MERDKEIHCREVRELMEGRPPFVTRHGVTLMLAAMAAGMALLMMTDTPAAGLAKGMAESVVQQLSSRRITPIK